jgi:3-oxoacyl-[acyl-carrier protein] reductase
MSDARAALVTGGARGIGLAIVEALAARGDRVTIADVDLEGARASAAPLEGRGFPVAAVALDVTDVAQVHRVLAEVDADQPLTTVVCNAGLAYDTAFPAMTGEDWDAVVHTNLDSFYNVLQPVVMPMVRRRAPGRIVTLASVSGLIGNRGQANYSAAKGGVIAATKALAVELAKREITVNCVAPGLIDTDMVDADTPMEKILEVIPMQRIGKPEEVAAAVSFLVSADAAYVTRQVISVNGGLC